MNPLLKLILKLVSSVRIDMQENYIWVRRFQKIIFNIKKPKIAYDFWDEKVYSKDNTHEIPVRIFLPEEKKHDENIIYIHGGGWVLGDIETYSQACINLANELGRVVFSIDYRLAPEHPYPAGLEDCLRAVEVLMASTADTDQKWIIMGDSAGGNLAAAVCLYFKKEHKKLPDKQILLYSVAYWDHSETSPFQSIITYGEDYGLTMKNIQEYMDMYAPIEEERKSPFIAPLMAEDLSDLLDTLIITAEKDPLRDEGEAYGKALRKAGNYVRIKRIKNTVHGFIQYPRYSEQLAEAYKVMGTFLNDKNVQ